MGKKITVIKASGMEDIYSEEKLRRSLARSGVSRKMIDEILNELSLKIYNGIPTKKIYKLAFGLLKRSSHGMAARYNLKKAIMSLGPSGFPFELYIAAIFEWQGYKVKTKQVLEGICVTHEIDVLAENDERVLLMECKYHNSQGIFNDVKLPLYIHSRYRDVLAMWEKIPANKPLEGWVVSNTKFSTDAVKYAACAGLHLLGWNYPLQNSLSKLVDESRLYPVTCLTTLTNKEKEQVLQAGIVLCRELASREELLYQNGISRNRVQNVLNEARELCRLMPL